VIRALEICSLTGKPVSAQRLCEGASHSEAATGVFVFRDRQELYERINQRVEMMFERGVIEEVRTFGEISQTASQMIGLREIRELLAGKKSLPQCIAEIQQATRRYAKRQLTWFRGQSNFLPLNLSFLTHNEAVKWISLRILSEARTRDD
jgi:tRNA dimethylallyltransferase